jgi:transcriptional regulator with XRE-family HTH domain
MNMSNFSKNLKRLRLDANLTQEQLSKKLSAGHSVISMYERGERKPSFEMLEKIADYFNVDLNYLIGRRLEDSPYLREELSRIDKERGRAVKGAGRPDRKKNTSKVFEGRRDIDVSVEQNEGSSDGAGFGGYYLDPETAAIAQEIYDNPDLRILFDASRKATADDLRKIKEMAQIMVREESGGDDV